MKEKNYKLKQKVYIIKNLIVEECVVIGVSLDMGTSESYKDSNIRNYYRLAYLDSSEMLISSFRSEELFVKESDAKKKLNVLFKNSKFKVNDIVIFENLVYKISRLKINVNNKFIYNLVELNDDLESFYSTSSNVSGDKLTKVNKKYIPNLNAFREIEKKLISLDKENSEELKKLNRLQAKTCKDINSKFKIYLNKFNILFNSESYNNAKILFTNTKK